MRTPWMVAAALAAAGACKKDSTPAHPGGGGGGADAKAIAQLDDLWKLAPKWAEGGMVITGDALVQADRALAFVHGVAGRFPGGADAVASLEEFHHELLGTAASYTDAGIDLGKGGAVFFTFKADDKGRAVAVVPLGDRDKLIATHGGSRDGDVDHVQGATCKPIGAAYACAKDAADLALGGGDLGSHAGVDGVRGDFEIVMNLPPLPPAAPLTPTGPLTVAVGIERGQVVVRSRLPATLKPPLIGLAKATPAGVKVDNASGFLILPVDVIDDSVPLADAPPPVRDLVKSIAGPLTAVIPSGVADVDIRLPLTDAAPARAIMAACGHVGPPDLPMVAGKDSCTIGPVPQLGVTGTVWIDGNSVRAARAQGAVAKSNGTPATAVGRELAGYTFAFWGRGAMIGADIPVPPEGRAALAAIAYLTEFGMGAKFTADGIRGLVIVRTIHANPDDVVAAIEDKIDSGDAAAIAAIAKAHPGAPIADDVAAGPTGVLTPVAGVGMLAAVAIPAFLEYTKRGKGSEADLALNRIAKSAKTYAVVNSAYPVGDSGRTPSTPSCAEPDKFHAPSIEPWASNPVWSQLDFAMTEPYRFDYRYAGTADEFTATAYIDADCDGTEMQVTAHGTFDAQHNPVVEFTVTGGPD